jgi:universal stress protein E
VQWRKILAVIDPTAHAQPALEKAARLALLCGAGLELFVCDVRQEIPESWAGGGSADEYRQLLRQRAQADLVSLAAPLRQLGLEVTVQYEWHAPLEQGIGQHVVRAQPDLVVKESHRHGVMDLATRHTDWNLIGQVPSDLLLVRPGVWPATPRLAAALDPLHPADRPPALDQRLLHAGRDLAALLQGSFAVFHVLQGPAHLPGDAVPVEQVEAAHAAARAAIDSLALGAGATPCYSQGSVVEGLVQLATAHAPDILLMGAVARPRSVHANAGGTAARVLDGIACDMLVLKPPGFVSPLLTTLD